MDIAAEAVDGADRARAELTELVDISSPSGDLSGAEAAVARCVAFLPGDAHIERLECSTETCAPDLLARIPGSGRRRLLLLGHLDTVIPHAEHRSLKPDGDRLLGPGTADMKGGVALALSLARSLAKDPGRFAELSVLMVCDEEWRTAPFRHVERFAGYDGCLCFEAGERSEAGEDGVVVRRKGAGTLRIRAEGRAAHSGSAPHLGRNALLALTRTVIPIAGAHEPEGPERLTVVPTVFRSGEAFNVVPASAEAVFDLRSEDVAAFTRIAGSVPAELDEVRLEASLERVWPAMDSEAAATPLLHRASELLGRRIVPRRRGGASDASHFAPAIPLTVDGLGPRGGGAHSPDEFIWADSLRERGEVALAVALAALTFSY